MRELGRFVTLDEEAFVIGLALKRSPVCTPCPIELDFSSQEKGGESTSILALAQHIRNREILHNLSRQQCIMVACRSPQGRVQKATARCVQSLSNAPLAVHHLQCLDIKDGFVAWCRPERQSIYFA